MGQFILPLIHQHIPKPLHIYSSSFYPHFATNPTLIVINDGAGEMWLTVNGTRTNQKFNIDLGESVVVDSFILQNAHSMGGTVEIGIKNFVLYGTNSSTAFDNTTYSDLTDLTELGTYQARKHIASNVSDPQSFSVENNTTAFRYYVLKIADSWEHATEIYMGFFHIEFNTVLLAKATLHTKVPTYSASVDTELVLSWDSTQPDNDEYVSPTLAISTLFGAISGNSGTGTSTYQTRCVILSTQISQSNSGKIRIKFQHIGTDYAVEDVYIWKKASTGDAWDGAAGTGVLVKFSGSNIGTITSTNRYSDPIDFDITGDDSVVICVFRRNSHQPYISTNQTGCSFYYKTAQTTPDSDQADVTGYSLGTGFGYIEALVSVPPSTQVWDSNFAAIYHMAQDPVNWWSLYP